MFGHHKIKVKPGKCLFVNISKDGVEITQFTSPPKNFIVNSNKIFRIEEYGKIWRVFLFIDGDLKNVFE